MYVSWNNFAVGRAPSKSPSPLTTVTLGPRTVSNTGTFIRNTQITGDMAAGTIYIAGMDEGGGGFPHNNINHIYRSTDGGNTWTNTYTGPSFPGPGVRASGYFACMFTDPWCLLAARGAGVSLRPSTTWFTGSMPQHGAAVTLATSITSAPPIAV